MATKLTPAQRKILEALSLGDITVVGSFGFGARPDGMNLHSLRSLASLSYIASTERSAGQHWAITDSGRAALAK